MIEQNNIMLNGIEVRESPNLPEFMTVPNKQHAYSKSKGMKYHERIQKKWNKRFGFTKQRTAYMVKGWALGSANDIIIAHPNTIICMKIAIDKN